MVLVGWIVTYHAYDLQITPCPIECGYNKFDVYSCSDAVTLQACWETVDLGIKEKYFDGLEEAISFMIEGQEYNSQVVFTPGMNLVNWNLIYQEKEL
jgi:hypothetical protein